MIDGKVAIPAKHKRIVCLVPVGVHDAAAANRFHGKTEQGFSADVWDHFHTYNPLAFKNTENRYFPSSAAAALAFPFSAEIALIKLDLAPQKRRGINGGTQDRMTYQHDRPMDGIIRYGKL